MRSEIINKFNLIQDDIKSSIRPNFQRPEIICVSKTFPFDKIMPLVNQGHIHFGENKVQETDRKWSEIRHKNKQIRLHMVGSLQTNKAKKAVELFDFIHSLDSIRLAEALKKREIQLQKKLSYFIQVNIGDEKQKGGIPLSEVRDFLNHCKNKIQLNVIGLMVIPPMDEKNEKYFKEVSNLNYSLGLKHLSMGMSGDYKIALKFNSTFLRIGSAIFGERKIN